MAKENSLVSIIIPTFNRAHLIEETLDSVLAQTYTNWECIIVDDGSNDGTDKLLTAYCKRDSRFQYHHRPSDRPKGANACRNYGFELSKGEFINWFDDDDLMLEDFIKLKLNALEIANCDFVFSKTINFLESGREFPMYQGDNKDKLVIVNNFILGLVTWCTPDFFSKKACLEGITFNVTLLSGQEYNYFVKLLLSTNNGLYVDKVLTKRRVHSDSTQEVQKGDKEKYRINKYKVYILTYTEILHSADKYVLNHLLDMAMSKAFDILVNNETLPNLDKLLNAVLKQKGFLKMNIYVISLIFASFLKKGYVLMNYSRR